MAGSKSVVLAALFANGAIAVLKFLGFLLTGSPSMLAETYHSISDTGNQVFLLVGIVYSAREADRTHPFGYGKAQFFYSFLVAVLLFGIAGWESVKHGYHEILHGGGAETSGGAVQLLGFTVDIALPFDPVWVNVGVLVGAIVFETYAFLKARTELLRQMNAYGWSGYREAFRSTSDVTTLTALTEDTIALVGAAVALVGVLLSHYTGIHVFDAGAALLIGLLLMGFALALGWENKRLIVGESLPPESENALRRVVERHPAVAHVDRFHTVFVGPQQVLVTTDLCLAPERTTEDVDQDIEEIERRLREADDRVHIVFVEPEV